MNALEASGVEFVYTGSVRALHDLDLHVRSGEFVALLGPNGSGKTTLFRLFGGLIKPSRGQILVAGMDTGKTSRDALYRMIGFIFQDPNDQLFANTVAEDVAFGPRNLGLPPEVLERKVIESLALVGITALKDRPIHTLSYGQKRRAALAGVLAMDPQVIILDEPTAGLDPMGASRIMGLLHRLNRLRGTTIVVATHDIDLVPLYADRVYILNEGRVVACGDPPHVFSQHDAIYRSDLRLPRAAQALKVVGEEIGRSFEGLPLTIEVVPMGGNGNAPNEVETGERREAIGFTTGAAAAAAARAAAEMLFHDRKVETIELRSPIGAILSIPISSIEAGDQAGSRSASATVIKRAGTPTDPTDGASICATVTTTSEPGVLIHGGVGVGRVTRPGLAVPVGQAAINPIPRQMIADAMSAVLPAKTGVRVTISVPGGSEMAELAGMASQGIQGGIAILGTTGLIDPNQQ